MEIGRPNFSPRDLIFQGACYIVQLHYQNQIKIKNIVEEDLFVVY